MKTYGRYIAVAGGLILAASGALPLMARNGISVNGFHPELGLQIGYWLLVIGIGLAGLAFLNGRTPRRLRWGLSILALLLAALTWWQGHKLGAVAWGTVVMMAGAVTSLAACFLPSIKTGRK